MCNFRGPGREKTTESGQRSEGGINSRENGRNQRVRELAELCLRVVSRLL